jgi:hypothetical protein
MITKKVFVSSILVTGLLCGAVGAYASDGVSVVQAYLNSTIKFTLNGASWTPKDNNGNKISPLIYNGSTYLPAKAVGDALNADVLWNGNSKTVSITTKGNTNIGEPYNDTTSPSASISPITQAPSSNVTAPPQNNTAGGALKLPFNFNLEAATDKNKSIGLAFIQAYGTALSSGSKSDLNALVDKYLTDELDQYNKGYKQSTKDYFAKIIAADLKENDSKGIEKYGSLLKNTALKDVQISSDYLNKSNYSAKLAYKVTVPGYIYSFNVLLEFTTDNNEDTYYLTKISIL